MAEKDPSLEQVLDHVDYISKLIGSDRIGVGPDYSDYFEDLVVAEVKAVPELYGSRLEYTKGLENAGTLRNLTRGLVSRGYSEKEILGILGENFLRVYQEILGA